MGARIAEQFSYRVTKDRKVLIYWQGRRVVVITGARAQKLLAELPGMDPAQEQLALAKATGNFKRGNERLIN
jgi:hypothetical protein